MLSAMLNHATHFSALTRLPPVLEAGRQETNELREILIKSCKKKEPEKSRQDLRSKGIFQSSFYFYR